MRRTSDRTPVGRVARAMALLLTLWCAVGVRAETDFDRAMREDTRWLSGFESRVVGSPGHDAAVRELQDRLHALPGVRVWKQEFTVLVPRTSEARLTVTGGPLPGVHRIYPLWPAGVRLNTTPEAGIAGRLLYLGEAGLGQAPARGLQDQIAVMELSGGENWHNAAAAGARAILLLGSEGVTHTTARAHLMWYPINIPRFYLPDGPLARALREGQATTGSLLCRARWEEATATNIYALVSAASPARPQQALAVGVPLDSMSIVPELAPGAEGAANVAFALGALRHFARRPPARPLLFSFVDAYAIDMLGARQMFAALALPPEEQTRRQYDRDEASLLEEQRHSAALADELTTSGSPPARLRLDRYRPVQDSLKDEVALELLAIDEQMQPKRLAKYAAEGAVRQALEREINEFSIQRNRLLGAQYRLLNGETIPEELQPLARRLWDHCAHRLRQQLAESETRQQAQRQRDALRGSLLEALGLTGQAATPLQFLLGVDLSSAGTAAGPNVAGRFLYAHETAGADAFLRWLEEVSRTQMNQVWPGELQKAVDLRPVTSLDSADSYTIGEVASLTETAASFGVPALNWATLDGFRARLDTPLDREDKLDWGRLAPQAEATLALLGRLTADASFAPPPQTQSQWRHISGFVVDQVPGEPLPRLPMEGYLSTLVLGTAGRHQASIPYWRAGVGGVRRQEFVRSGADGRFRFDFMPGMAYDPVTQYGDSYFLQAYQLAPDGSITRAIDDQREGRGATLNASVWDSGAAPLRGAVFSCRELNVFSLVDPRFLIALPSASLLDARRGDEPHKLSYSLCGGVLSALLEPGVTWQMILRTGVTANRMALLNLRDSGAGISGTAGATLRERLAGFAPGQPLPSHPVQLAAQDYFRLDQMRLEDYARAGITSEPIMAIQTRTQDLLAQTDAARQHDDGPAFFRSASAALASEVRAYKAIRDLAGDVVRAAVFLLLALVPLSFILERLLLACTHIYRQLIATAIIFALLTAVLWSFHPAFRISSQPLIIIMAFGIIFISLMVILMIWFKFETGMEELKSERAEAASARTSRMGLIMTAMRLGIANMRKRRFRTALTAITIMLVTFSLLCFISTTNYTGQKEFSVGGQAGGQGVLLRQSAYRALPTDTPAYLENFLGQGTQLACRYWWLNPNQREWRLHVQNPATARQVSLKAGLGLTAEEARVSHIDRVCAGWERFAAGRGCYLAQDTAEELGAQPGQRVIVAGQELELLGTFDPDRFNREVTGLDGQPITPLNYHALGDSQRANLMQGDSDLQMLSADMQKGAGMAMEQDLPHLPASAVAILPAGLLRMIQRDCTLRGVSVATGEVGASRALARDLVERFAFPVYFSAPDGIRVMATTPLLPRAPRSIWIPLLIAGLIVFNTMLSSLAERKREIYIYTSLGLAPVHIGFLFLSEAVTYGLMGAVFGYLFGQGLAVILGKLGWLGSITLNYSGTQAIAVMTLVLAVVIVSSLLPAWLAGRLAMPSNKMSWRVPAPEGDTIRDTLPFTVTPRIAGGVIVFLLDYFRAHREGGIGHFCADELTVGAPAVDDPQSLPNLQGSIWLAPYDLGVRQEFRLVIQPTDEEEILGIEIELRRCAGQTSNWVHLNRTFLADLRRQMLGWSKQAPERILAYVARAEAPEGPPELKTGERRGQP